MTLTVAVPTVGATSYASARMSSARTQRLSPPWLARLAEEFILQGCSVFHDPSPEGSWDLVVSFPKGRQLRLVWCDRIIRRGPLAVRIVSPEKPRDPRQSARTALEFKAAARAAGFVPIVAFHEPRMPERSLWLIEVL